MVLDTFLAESDMFIFKNTYDQDGQPKQFQVSRSDPSAPEELYFVHIEVKDINNLPCQERRKELKEAEIERKKQRRI